MSTTNTKTAACLQADHTQSALTFAWTLQKGLPYWSDHFALLLNHRLKQLLPDGCLKQILKGQESEIRQSATLILLERFFKGNERLQRATEQEDLAEVTNQIQRSINAALRLARCRVRRSIQQDHRRFTLLDEQADVCQLMHPAYREKAFELPFEAQRALLLLLLESAVATRSISPGSSQIVQRMVDQKLSQAEMAAELGISRQAINQRIRCVASALADSLEKAEFPIQS